MLINIDEIISLKIMSLEIEKQTRLLLPASHDDSLVKDIKAKVRGNDEEYIRVMKLVLDATIRKVEYSQSRLMPTARHFLKRQN